jgi:hypothetical protein
VLVGLVAIVVRSSRVRLASVVRVAGLVARGGGRSCGLARRQRNSANDFVGQLGIRIHDDLHRHVEVVALVLLLRDGAAARQAQQQECSGRDARPHDHCLALR